MSILPQSGRQNSRHGGLFRLAKKGLKRGLESAQRKILKFGRRKIGNHIPLVNCEEEFITDCHYRKQNTEEQKKAKEEKKRRELFDRSSIIIPFLLIRSDIRGNYELYCDHLDLLVENFLADCKGVRYLGDVVTFQHQHLAMIFKTIVSRVSGIKELILDSIGNTLIMQTIIDFYQVINNNSNHCERFHLENLSIVGSTRMNDMEVLSSLLMLSRRSLQCLRLRYCKVHSSEQALRLWTAVSQCSKLNQLQYEPYKSDPFSRPYLVDAITRKKMTSLILTDVEGISNADVIAMANGGGLHELAVIGDNITPYLYAMPETKKIVQNLDSLLIQNDETFDLNDCQMRNAILCTLLQLSSSSLLEVIHTTKPSVSDTAKVISYWLQLANESERTIMLKLEDCSQDRQDAAVGRVLRKCRKAQKSSCSENGISLCLANGELIVLDKKTWFTDENI
ncbi:unnamed protein product [Caenorhabditis bovis]|uniref:Uncharacterized protein n=1 Tax=Caenorhabditis bovis TaxID=2654633 RepID=A0A8S1F234_9PELO|nr:unnamed protein product [Caenorhabditis bovis]